MEIHARKKKIGVGKLKSVDGQVCRIEVKRKNSAMFDFSSDMFDPDLEEVLATESSAVISIFKKNCKLSSIIHCESDEESYVDSDNDNGEGAFIDSSTMVEDTETDTHSRLDDDSDTHFRLDDDSDTHFRPDDDCSNHDTHIDAGKDTDFCVIVETGTDSDKDATCIRHDVDCSAQVNDVTSIRHDIDCSPKVATDVSEMFNFSKDKETESSKTLQTPGQGGDCNVHHAEIGKSSSVMEENKIESVNTVTHTKHANKVGESLDVTQEREAGSDKTIPQTNQDANYIINDVEVDMNGLVVSQENETTSDKTVSYRVSFR